MHGAYRDACAPRVLSSPKLSRRTSARTLLAPERRPVDEYGASVYTALAACGLPVRSGRSMRR